MKKRRNNYKFTRKKHSKRGMISCALAAASVAAMCVMFFESYQAGGNGSVYLGSAGILALAAAICSLVQAVKSLKEEDSFQTFPRMAIVLSLLAAGGWTALYAVGFLL